MNTRIKALCLAIVMLLAVLPYTCLAEDSLNIVSSMSLPIFDEYAKMSEKSINLEIETAGIMEVLAQAYATKDENVDIYVINAYDGLYTLKKKGYYEPLQADSKLAAAYADLYPAFQKAISNNDDLVGWILYAQPIVRAEDNVALQLFGLSSPTTINDFLDTCNQLLQSDSFADDYTLMDTMSYTQKDMLDFYMRQYIMACQLAKQRPDFTEDGFLSIVNRIITELPLSAELYDNESESDKTAIFSLPAAYEFISKDMIHMPRVLESQNNAVETYATIAVVNPYSNNKEGALEFLRYCVSHQSENAYFYRASMITPVENLGVINRMDEICEKEKQLESTDALTNEQKNMLQELKTEKEDLESRRYLISADDIAYYHNNIVNDLWVDEGSPIHYDDVLRQYVDRLLNGELNLNKFGDLCQSHVEMIYKEM